MITRATLLALALVLVLLASCTIADPFGMTQREQIRSDTAITVADIEAQAAIKQTALETEASQENAKVWASVLPSLALILVGGVIIGMVVYFRGRAHLMEVACLYPAPSTLPEPTGEQLLQLYAASTSQNLVFNNGAYYLTDPVTGKTVRALPKP